jgi:hypothetical protein
MNHGRPGRSAPATAFHHSVCAPTIRNEPVIVVVISQDASSDGIKPALLSFSLSTARPVTA